MKKVLLALFVLIMLGYSAFTLYMVVGMQRSSTVEESCSEEQVLLCAAYANVQFSELSSEYQEPDNGAVTEEFADGISEIVKDSEKLEAVIQNLALEGYTAELLMERILVEVNETEALAVTVTVLDEDQYTAADLCNGVLDILKAADLSELCSGIEILEVGTEEYSVS